MPKEQINSLLDLSQLKITSKIKMDIKYKFITLLILLSVYSFPLRIYSRLIIAIPSLSIKISYTQMHVEKCIFMVQELSINF